MRMGKRRWFGLGLLLFVALVVAVCLLSTFALKVGFNQVPGLAPVQGLSGRAIGPIAAEQLVWSQDGMTVTVDGLHVDHAPLSLFGGHVKVTAFSARKVHVALPPAVEETQDQAAGPFRLDLPKIDLPFDISSAPVRIEQVLIVDAKGQTLVDTDFQVESFSVVNGLVELTALRSAERTRGTVELTAKLDSNRAWAGQVQLEANLLEPINSLISVRSDGDLKAMRLEIDSSGEIQTQLRGDLADLDSQPRWEFELNSSLAERAQLRESMAPGRLALQLSGSGDAESAELRGDVHAAGYAVQLNRLAASRGDGGVELQALDALIDGQLSAQLHGEGHWPLDASGEAGDLKLRWQNLNLADAEPALDSEAGELSLRGYQDAYAFELTAELLRGDLAGTLRAAGDGTAERLSDLSLRLDSTAGQLNVGGEYQFQPIVADMQVAAVELKPELLAAQWPGLVSLQADVKLRDDENGLSVEAVIDELGGQLRGAALSGQGTVMWVAESWPTGSLQLGWGGNEVEYAREPDQAGRLQVDAANLRLGTPDLDGHLMVDLTVPELLSEWIEVTGSADARELRLPGLELDRLSARRAAGSTSAIAIEGSGLAAGGVALDSFDLQLEPGSAQDWGVTLAALGPDIRLQMDAQFVAIEEGWSGTVSRLQAEQQPWPEVSLDQPAQWSWSAGELVLQRSCLIVVEGELCFSAQSIASGNEQPADVSIEAQLERIPLEPLRHLNPEMDLRLTGELAGTAQMRVLGGGGFSLAAAMAAPDMKLSLPNQGSERIEREIALQIDAGPGQGAVQRLAVRLRSELGGELVLSAEGDPLAEQADWLMQLQADALDLGLIDGVSPELVGPKGTLTGGLRASLVDGQLVPVGELQLNGVGAELPSAGTQVSDLNMVLGAGADGELTLRGTGKLGEGEFQLDGSVSMDANADARLVIKGADLLVADLPIVRMTVSPDLQIERSAGKVTANGSVTIPSALIDLARFEPTVQASSDVVVIDDDVDEGVPLALFADIRVVVGDDVRLKGFGLDGRLQGSLSLRERPGKLATARGEMDVTGNYRAYGQDLDIQRGKLLFTGGPVGNPGLDLLALRELSRVKAGVRVRGAADSPVLTLYSDPPMDQAEALSYLVLGRPLNSASGNDGEQLGAAAAALGSVGGSLLASKLGAGTGLEVGVESSSDLGGAALTVGRFLTPKLYFGVGQSLFESLSVAILRYRLSSSWELEGISGREFKAGVNYKMER